MSHPDAETCLERMAQGLGSRLRDVQMAQARWDRFVNEPGEPPPTPELGAFSAEAEPVATDLVLRTLRAGVDPVNHRILAGLLEGEGSVPVADLMGRTGLPRVVLTERVNELAQVGLASYSPESRRVQATALTEGFLGLVGEVRHRLLRIMA